MLGQLLGVENSAYGWTEIMAGVRIRQLKDTEPSDTPPFQVPAGWIQILFCREGGLQADLRSGRQVRCAERCVLVLAGPAQIQCLRVLRERLNGVLVEVDAVLARDGLEKLGQLLGGMRFHLRRSEDLLCRYDGCTSVGDTPWSEAVFAALGELPAKERERYCALKAAELLYLFGNGDGLLPRIPEACYFDRHQVETVQRLHDYMAAHLEEHLTIEGLSRQFYISPTLLKRCFRQLYGKPIHSALRDYRMERAARLLTETDQPVVQIAAAVGYGSVSQFGVAFKERYRITPALYRRKERKKV